MTFWEILLMALSLSVDTLVVSVSGSTNLNKTRIVKVIYIAFTFGLMQAALLFVGWVFGHSIADYIDKYSSIIGFALLLYVGVSMIVNALKKGEDSKVNLVGFKSLLLAAVATSIDASAVGVSLAMTDIVPGKMYLSALLVFVVTALASVCGVICGSYLGRKFGRTAQITGGIVLLAIGTKILFG